MISSWKITTFWILLGLSLVLGVFKFFYDPVGGLPFFDKSEDSPASAEALVDTMYNVLFSYGIRVEWFSEKDDTRIVRIPKDLLLIEPYVELVWTFKALGANLLRAESNPDGDRMSIEVGHGSKSLFTVTLVKHERLKRTAGEIALVIDDFGNAFNSNIEGFLDLEQPITFSILPGLKYSRKTDAAAAERQREVMVHMPMEPQNGGVGSDEFMLRTGMDAREISRRIRKARASVPHARGLNNHMGSRATVDEKLLAILMDEIKRPGFYFLDSHTASETRAFALARERQVTCAINDTFLDNIKEEPYIRKKLHKLAELAATRGHAIGIGHPYKETLAVLQKELPKLEKKGFTFVGVSEVMQ